MTLRRMFGSIITIIGIIGLVFVPVSIVNGSLGADNMGLLIAFSVLSLVFFISGISLMRIKKDRA